MTCPRCDELAAEVRKRFSDQWWMHDRMDSFITQFRDSFTTEMADVFIALLNDFTEKSTDSEESKSSADILARHDAEVRAKVLREAARWTAIYESSSAIAQCLKNDFEAKAKEAEEKAHE